MNAVEALAQEHQDGVFAGVTDVVERIVGRQPRSLADFGRANDRALR